ncbi:hypothetical protein [Streptomyces lavendofoliae]|uniref:Uncharacterized protein n=1 Tax=Streptomyces lavendofoliae TaxID=67314 RepID=A0A918HY10_9ACTN|nr:hypothetical protein [Streptomyces lavendofoliae]GGU40048.1 hypothetical protein GCM10010274_29660 [Streptomyces lavendofoliae]
MNPTFRTLRMAQMTLLELTRRRGVLGLLLLVPLVFYLGRHDEPGQAIRFASLGLGFAVSAAALFSSVGGREIEPRLALGGFRPRHLHLGRVLALVTAGLVVSALYALLIAVDQDVRDLAAVALELALTTLVAVPLGLLLGLAVPRDMEGTLLLISVIGAQMVMDPAKDSARALPFWSTREIITYAVDGPGAASLAPGVTHALVTAVLLTAVSSAVQSVRLRRRAHMQFG